MSVTTAAATNLLSLRLNVVTAAPVAEVVGHGGAEPGEQDKIFPREPHRECPQTKVLMENPNRTRGIKELGHLLIPADCQCRKLA